MSNLISRKQRKQLDALRAENEALKTDVKTYRNAAKSYIRENEKIQARQQEFKDGIETKDAQIKQLVEALGVVKTECETELIGVKNPHTKPFARFHHLILKALSTIPDVEGYRLEREVVAESMAVCHKALNGGAFNIHELRQRVQALEAYREKVKNNG